MSAPMVIFWVAMFCAGFAALYGGRVALVLVIGNMIAVGADSFNLDFSRSLWIAFDLVMIAGVALPGFLKWGGITQKNTVICSLFVVAWCCYSAPPEVALLVSSSVTSLQLALSLPWTRWAYILRARFRDKPMPPRTHFDEAVRHG